MEAPRTDGQVLPAPLLFAFHSSPRFHTTISTCRRTSSKLRSISGHFHLPLLFISSRALRPLGVAPPLPPARTYAYAYGRTPCVRTPSPTSHVVRPYPPPPRRKTPRTAVPPVHSRSTEVVLGAGPSASDRVYERINLVGRSRWSRRDALRCAATSAKTARKKWPNGWIPSASSTTCSRIESSKKSSDSWCVVDGIHDEMERRKRSTERNTCAKNRRKKKTWDDEGIKRVERTDAMHHRGMAAAANVLRTTLSCFLHRP